MSYNMGSGARVAIGKEGAGAWGTPVADTMLLSFTSEDIKPEISKVGEDSLLATKAAAGYGLMGIKVSGSVSGVLKPDNAGLLLRAALGGADTTTVVTGQQQHDFNAAAANGAFPSYTVFIDRKQAIKRYSGMKVNSLQLTAKAGDYVRYTVGFKGKDESTGTIATSAVPSLKAYKLIGGTLTLGGTAVDITQVEFGIQNNMDDGIQTNTSGTYNTEPLHAARKIQISIEIPYDASAETIRETNFKAEAVLASAVLHLESPAIIASTYKYRVDITLNNVAVLEASVNVGSSGLLVMSIKGEATAVGATEPVAVTVYDNVAAAY